MLARSALVKGVASRTSMLLRVILSQEMDVMQKGIQIAAIRTITSTLIDRSGKRIKESRLRPLDELCEGESKHKSTQMR